MKRVTAWFADEAHRAYVYRVLVSLGPVAAVYGLLNQEQVAVWSAVAAQTLGVGLAARHTTTRKENNQ